MSTQQPSAQLIFEYAKRLIGQWVFVFTLLTGLILGANTLTYDFQIVTPLGIMIIVGTFLIANFRVFADIYRRNKVLQQQLNEINYAKPDLRVYLDHDGELTDTLPIEVGDAPDKPKFEEDESGYLNPYDEYLIDNYHYQLSNARMRYISVAICNHGAVDAENIRIECTLHGNVRTANYDLLTAYHNDPPKPPPRNEFLGVVPTSPMRVPYIEPNSEEGPHFDDDSDTFTFTPSNLAPGACERRLASVPLQFGHPQPVESPWIEVKKYAKGINPPTNQELHFEVTLRNRE